MIAHVKIVNAPLCMRVMFDALTHYWYETETLDKSQRQKCCFIFVIISESKVFTEGIISISLYYFKNQRIQRPLKIYIYINQTWCGNKLLCGTFRNLWWSCSVGDERAEGSEWENKLILKRSWRHRNFTSSLSTLSNLFCESVHTYCFMQIVDSNISTQMCILDVTFPWILLTNWSVRKNNDSVLIRVLVHFLHIFSLFISSRAFLNNYLRNAILKAQSFRRLRGTAGRSASFLKFVSTHNSLLCANTASRPGLISGNGTLFSFCVFYAVRSAHF